MNIFTRKRNKDWVEYRILQFQLQDLTKEELEKCVNANLGMHTILEIIDRTKEHFCQRNIRYKHLEERFKNER